MVKNKWLPYLTATALLALYFYLFRDRVASLVKLPPMEFFPLAILSILILIFLILNGVRIWLITRLFGVHLQTREWLGLAFLTAMGNYLPLQGGMVGRGIYLYKRHQISPSHYASIVTGGIAIFLTANAFLGILACLWLIPILRNKLAPFFILFLVLLAVTFAIFMTPLFRKLPENQWTKIPNQVLEGWDRIRKNRSAVTQLFAVDIIIALVFSLRIFSAAWIIGMPLPFNLCIIIATVTMTLALIPITPASIGVREGTAGLITTTLAAGAQEGLIATGFDRIIATFWIFLLGSLSSYILIQIYPGGKSKEIRSCKS